MRNKRKIYTVFQLGSAIFMILALIWLTVSAPFVYDSQQFSLTQKNNPENNQTSNTDNENDTSSPFSNTTEEKNSNTTSFSEELLHEHSIANYSTSIVTQYHICLNEDTYIAYHGELLVPPPNAA